MPSVEKRGEFWRVRVRRHGFPTQSRTFDNKALAERWAREIENTMDRGDFVDRSEAEKNTLDTVLKRYAAEVSPSKKGAAPEIARIAAIRRQSVCEIKMSALSSAHLAAFRDERLKLVSPGTVNRELNIISHAIEVARREWAIYMPDNPARMVRRPKQPKARERRFAKGEEKKLFAACNDARNPFLLPVVRLAIETGMRQSEIVGLENSRINLKKRYLVLADTKNGEQRSVPLSPKAIQVIKALQNGKGKKKKTKPKKVEPTEQTGQSESLVDGRLFPGLTTEAVKRAFMRATSRAALEDFHFHDLRHEATSRLFELGLNPMEVASITGHKTLQMLRRYTHLDASDLAKKLRS